MAPDMVTAGFAPLVKPVIDSLGPVIHPFEVTMILHASVGVGHLAVQCGSEGRLLLSGHALDERLVTSVHPLELRLHLVVSRLAFLFTGFMEPPHGIVGIQHGGVEVRGKAP